MNLTVCDLMLSGQSNPKTIFARALTPPPVMKKRERLARLMIRIGWWVRGIATRARSTRTSGAGELLILQVVASSVSIQLLDGGEHVPLSNDTIKLRGTL